MNSLSKKILNNFSKIPLKVFYLFNKKQNRIIYNIISKGKFRAPHQPGLSRHNYDNETYEPLPFEGVAEYGWGHPNEYIKLSTRYMDKPNICKYCGLRYVKKQHHH